MATESISDPREHYDVLSQKITQLGAMLTLTYGNSAEVFSDLSDETRDNYMWACASMARECEELIHHLGGAVYRPKAASEVQHG